MGLNLDSRQAPGLTLQSFFIGGFECATHRRRDRKQVDVVAATRHDVMCEEDYRRLAKMGVYTVRDGLRWHLIETEPGRYDWSSFEPMLDGALRSGTQVIWDLCHWGVPADLSPFDDAFAPRFEAFAAAAAHYIRQRSDEAGVSRPTLLCPINEISFWSWVGGDEEHFFPYAKAQAPRLKQQLAKAAVCGMRAALAVDPAVRFVQPEPLIQIDADKRKPEDKEFAERYTEGQYEAWDMLAGRLHPELGGAEDLLDVVGVNYYWNNQWIHRGDRMPPGHPQHVPLHRQLVALWERYRRPILITETGAEGDAGAGWLGYVAAEVRQALRLGVPVSGICLYPVMDYVGWDNERHCRCGLIACEDEWTTRADRPELVAELQAQQAVFARLVG